MLLHFILSGGSSALNFNYCREDWIASRWPIFSNKVGTGTALLSPGEDTQMFSGGEQLKQYDVLRVPIFFLFWKYSILYLKDLEK